MGFPAYEGKEVSFPFGHRLSYSSFRYSSLRLSLAGAEAPQPCAGSVACVRISITNTGRVLGAEVAQLYLGFPPGSGEPPKLLRGFSRTELLPRQRVDVAFPLSLRDLQVGGSLGWRIVEGALKIYVGASSRDIRLHSEMHMCDGKASAVPCAKGSA